MGFLDQIKEKIDEYRGVEPADDEYYDDDYDDDYDGRGSRRSSYSDRDSFSSNGRNQDDESDSNGVLNQPHRGEAESIAVYTRSGKLVSDADRHATTYNPPARSTEGYRSESYGSPVGYAPVTRPADSSVSGSTTTGAAASRMSEVLSASPQLPAYILQPESYDDVETVVRRVRTKQPVALVFVGVRTDIAKRVLDFSYGFACGLGASVEEVGDRVFMVLPPNCEVKETDLQQLETAGYLKRS